MINNRCSGLMNPPSLSSYKDECYNIGSPRPDPLRRLSDSFPKLKSGSTNIPKIKSGFESQIPAPKSGRKRSHREVEGDSKASPNPTKKLKMGPEEIEVIRKLIAEGNVGRAEKTDIDAIDAKIREVVSEEVGKVRADLVKESSSRKVLETTVERLEADMATLKSGTNGGFR